MSRKNVFCTLLSAAAALAVVATSGNAQEATVEAIVGPQEPPYRPKRPIAIVGGTVIDGTGAAPKLDYTLVIKGQTIAAIGPDEDIAIPDGAELIDAEGMTVMPGLINSNQHLQINPLLPAPTADLPVDTLKARWEKSFARMERRAFVYLMQGMTSMRQTSGPAERLLPVKRRIEAGEIAGPRIFLGGGLFTSPEHFRSYIEAYGAPEDAVGWLRNDFAYNVIDDVEADTERYTGDDFDYWKLYMSNAVYDGGNDFSDEELRRIIAKAHAHGKKVDVHAGPHNPGLARMLDFDIDTLEHPFYGTALIEREIIRGYAEKGVIVASLLQVMTARAERAVDPHRFSETPYLAAMTPEDYRRLLRYRDKLLFNKRHPDQPGIPLYDSERILNGDLRGAERPFHRTAASYAELQRQLAVSRENARRFIRAGVKFSLGTDTPAFFLFHQEDHYVREMQDMVELGMAPLQVVTAATRNGAEALGMLDRLGTLERGKLADVIVVAGNPLADMAAMKRIYAVVKGGVRYK